MPRLTPADRVAVPTGPSGAPLARTYKAAKRQAAAVRDADAAPSVALTAAERSVQRSMEVNPELAADFALRAAAGREEIAELERAAKAAGLGPRFVAALVNRMRRTPELMKRAEKLTNDTLVSIIDAKLELALSYMDEVAMAGASARDIAIISGVLLDKRLLLQGQPTQIVSHVERRQIDELLPAVLKEAQRRGIDLTQGPDGSYSVGSSSAAGDQVASERSEG